MVRSVGVAVLLLAAAGGPAVPSPLGCGLHAYRAAITRVVDGDTVVADVDLGLGVWRHGEHLRLLGVDAPELRGPGRMDGLVAQAALAERVSGRSVVVCTADDRRDSFGRVLVVIWAPAGDAFLNVNDWLVTRGFAEPYASD